MSLGESESCGVLVKVTMAVSCHGEGVDGLAGQILQVFRNKGQNESFTELFKGLLFSSNLIVCNLDLPTFRKGGSLSLAHFTKGYQYAIGVAI